MSNSSMLSILPAAIKPKYFLMDNNSYLTLITGNFRMSWMDLRISCTLAYSFILKVFSVFIYYIGVWGSSYYFVWFLCN